ncbi:unnamed protein product [Agarophyton chilense]
MQMLWRLLLSRPLAIVVAIVAVTAAVAAAAEQELPPSPLERHKLLFVLELCRHGDRAPLNEFPSDALPASQWPEGVGELTSVGQRAHFDLGQRLRQRYVDSGFLPQSFSPKLVYVRSTDIDRTLVSATAQMAGLYPPGTASNQDVGLRFGAQPLTDRDGGLPHLFQPVPIHTESKQNEILLLPDRNCPRLDHLLKHRFRLPPFVEKLKQESAFLRAAALVAKRDPETFTIWDLEKLSDTWTCFQHHSVPLPHDATPEIVLRARNLSYWLLDYVNQGVELNRLRAGLILYNARQLMTVAALKSLNKLPLENEPDYKKFVLYSAHDTTVAATLAALRAFDGRNPPYNSTLIWELYAAEGSSKFFVKLEYNGTPLLLPGCSDTLCPADEYLRSTAHRTVEGEIAKKIECFIGLRRLGALAGSLFSTKKSVPTYANLVFHTDDHTSGGASVEKSAIALIMALIVIVGACGVAARLRSRYGGYVPTNDALDEDAPYRQPIVQNHVSERRILV